MSLMMKKSRRIGIIGGGFTGLTAAYKLAQKSHRVFVFEKEEFLGGLAAGFKRKNYRWSAEHFYHHFLASDTDAKKLIRRLGLSQKLFFKQAKTSIFKKGKIVQLDSASSILKFSLLNLHEKLRVGLITAYLKSTNNWKKLEKTAADSWLSKFYGQKVYQTLWEPLLSGKFGKQKNKISMAWFWARVKKRSKRLGYLEGGFQILVDKLTEKIKENNGKVFLNQEVENIASLKEKNKLDQIIVTTPTSIFLKMAPKLPQNYKNKLRRLKMIGSISLLLELKEKFLKDNTYWLNINSPGFPFVAVVEHTNFVDLKHYNGQHLVYVGGYYSPNHRFFKMTKNQILKEFLPYLKKINPAFDFSHFTSGIWIYANPSAQPIVPINYSKIIPSFKTPIPGVYLANMQMVYPWDRGINYAIKLGEKIADEISQK